MAKSKPAPAPQIDRDGAGFSAPDTDGITDADLGEVEAPAAPKAKPSPTASDEGKPPPFGTPTVASAKGPLPRVCKPTERANDGQARFKVSCRNYSPQPVKYILARDEDEAADCYLRVTKLHDTLTKLKKQAGAKADDVEAPELAVTALSD